MVRQIVAKCFAFACLSSVSSIAYSEVIIPDNDVRGTVVSVEENSTFNLRLRDGSLMNVREWALSIGSEELAGLVFGRDLDCWMVYQLNETHTANCRFVRPIDSAVVMPRFRRVLEVAVQLKIGTHECSQDDFEHWKSLEFRSTDYCK